LAGLKYDKEGTMKVDGEDDLPLLQPWAVSFNEAYYGGMAHSGISDPKHGNQPILEELTLTYRVVCSRRNGWFRRDPLNSSQKKGLIEWLALIRDAIETDKQGIVDSRFNRSASQPILYSISDTETTELSFQCYFEAKMKLWPYHRSERHFVRAQQN
jgi:hypothetical protein